MVQSYRPTTTTSSPNHPQPDRIIPLNRRWRVPRYRPHPDAIAVLLIFLLISDFIDRVYRIAAEPQFSYYAAVALFIAYLVGLWAIWRLSRAAGAYYDAHPLIRRGLHQHGRRYGADFYDAPYYHQHRWAFPLHNLIFRANHQRHSGN